MKKLLLLVLFLPFFVNLCIAGRCTYNKKLNNGAKAYITYNVWQQADYGSTRGYYWTDSCSGKVHKPGRGLTFGSESLCSVVATAVWCNNIDSYSIERYSAMYYIRFYFRWGERCGIGPLAYTRFFRDGDTIRVSTTRCFSSNSDDTNY